MVTRGRRAVLLGLADRRLVVLRTRLPSPPSVRECAWRVGLCARHVDALLAGGPEPGVLRDGHPGPVPTGGASLSIGLTLWANRRAQPDDLTSTPSAWKARTPSRGASFVGVGIAGVAATAALWTLVNVDDAICIPRGLPPRSAPRPASWPAWWSRQQAASPVCWLLGAAPIPRSHFLRDVSVALPALSVDQCLEHRAEGGICSLLRFTCTVVIATSPTTSWSNRSDSVGFWGPPSKSWVAAPAAILAVVVAVVAAPRRPSRLLPPPFVRPIRQTGPLYSGPPVRLLLVGDSTAYTLGLGLSAYQSDYDIKLNDQESWVVASPMDPNTSFRASSSDGEPLQRRAGVQNPGHRSGGPTSRSSSRMS